MPDDLGEAETGAMIRVAGLSIGYGSRRVLRDVLMTFLALWLEPMMSGDDKDNRGNGGGDCGG